MKFPIILQNYSWDSISWSSNPLRATKSNKHCHYWFTSISLKQLVWRRRFLNNSKFTFTSANTHMCWRCGFGLSYLIKFWRSASDNLRPPSSFRSKVVQFRYTCMEATRKLKCNFVLGMICEVLVNTIVPIVSKRKRNENCQSWQINSGISGLNNTCRPKGSRHVNHASQRWPRGSFDWICTQ